MLNGLSVVVTGSSHEAIGLECQDYAELEIQNENYALAAAADGHGSKKHFRSAKGSQFAAEAAKESVYEYMKDYEKFVEGYKKDKEYLISKIIKMVIAKWHEKIQEDLDSAPITREEIDKYLDGDFKQDKVASIYGTTLLVGVMSEECNFGFLIGDGSFVVIDKYGKAFIPIEDENSKANYTSSLSSSSAYEGFVVHFFDKMPFAIMVSTDGLVKSFGNDNAFLDYNQAIAMEVGKLETEEDRDNMEVRLQNLFDKRSREGSEDDISISIIYNREGFENVLNGLKTRRSLNKLQEQIDKLNKEILSLDFRAQQIKSEKKVNVEELNNLRDVRNKCKELNKGYQLKIEQLKEQIKKIEEDITILSAKKEDNETKQEILTKEITRLEEIGNQKEEELKNNTEEKEMKMKNIESTKLEKDKLENSLN